MHANLNCRNTLTLVFEMLVLHVNYLRVKFKAKFKFFSYLLYAIALILLKM